MTRLKAFGDELEMLTKQAGVAKYLAGKAVKKPLNTLGALAVTLPAAAAGASGYAKGRAMGKPARYLKASEQGPSNAFWTNWQQLMSRRKLKPHELERLHENYNESALRR